jgi:hypothetical protein
VREEALVVAVLAVDAVREHGDHVFVGLLVEVVDLVALVEDVCHEVWRRGVGYCRGDDVGHVAEVFVLG